MVGTRQAPAGCATRLRRVVVERRIMIEGLPKNLSDLDHEQIQEARQCRDERMTRLFGDWPALSDADMRELRTLSFERLRLAKHVGHIRHLRALR